MGMEAELDANYMYGQAFGNGIVNKFKYWDPMNGVDFTKDIGESIGEFEKAANVGASSGAAGYIPMPLVYDRDVVDITRKMTPLQAMIPKVTNQGLTANYFRLTARGAPTWGTEQGALTESDDTKSLASSNIKYCRIAGRVTGVGQVGGQHFLDTVRQEVLQKTQSMNEELEDVLINGDASTYPLEPNGLIKLLTANTTNMAGTEVSLSDVKNTVHECFVDKGRPNLIITDAYTAGKLEEQMLDFARYTNPMTSIAWGLQTLSINTVVGQLPIVVSQFMPETSNSRRILVVDTNQIEWRVLQDIMFERLAKTDDSEKFYLKFYGTLINKFPEGMGQIYGIA